MGRTVAASLGEKLEAAGVVVRAVAGELAVAEVLAGAVAGAVGGAVAR